MHIVHYMYYFNYLSNEVFYTEVVLNAGKFKGVRELEREFQMR